MKAFQYGTEFISISDICRSPASIFDAIAKNGKKMIVIRNNKPIGCISGINHFNISEVSDDTTER